MSKVNIKNLCDNCDSEFTISFKEELVSDYDSIKCPFCGEVIESTDAEDSDEYDYSDNSWDD